MTENRAELILALRDEISAGMAKINAAVGTSKQEIAGLSGAGQQAAAGLSSLKDHAAAAGDTVRKALAFAGVVVGLYEVASAVKELYSSILEIGGKQEVLQGSMYALGQMYGISKVNLDDMRDSLQNMDVPLDTATKGINSFIKSGLNLSELPGFVKAVKDIAVTQGKSFTETWDAAIKSVVLGSGRGLREIEVNLGDMATVAGKSIKDIEQEAGLTASQKSKIMLDALMGYAKQFEGISESATGSYLKQQLKLKNAAEEAKVALFDSLKPLAMAITGEKIQAWEDLYTWVSANQVALTAYAEGLGVFVGKAANTIKMVLEFTAAHKDLVYTLLEGYGIYKISAGILVPVGVALYNAAAGAKTFAVAQLATTAVVNPGIAAVAGLGGAATTASTGIAAASGAAVAANVAFAAWIPTIAAVGLALIALGGISIKRQVEKTPSLVGDMLMGEAYGVMSEAERSGMFASGQEADAQAAAARRLTKPATGAEGQKESWEQYQRQHQKDEFAAAMKKIQEQQTTNMPDKAGKGGGGKGEAAAENSLENFVSRMKQETAKAAGEGMAVLDAWYGKESQTLDGITAKVGESLDARNALKDAYDSKGRKLEQEFQNYVAKESGKGYAEIEAQSNTWLQKVGGNIDQVMQLWNIKSQKEWELDVKNYTERLGLEKGYYDQAAQLSPVLSDQINFKRKALELDIEEKRYAEALKLNKLELAGVISCSQADEYRGRQALLDQQQRFNFEMENNKGLSGWAYARVKSENQKNTWADAMEGLESFVNDAWTQGAQGALSKVKVDVIELGKTFALSAALSLGKQGIHKLFTGVAEAIVGAGQLGTENNPMVVKIKGLGLPEIGKGAGITQAGDFAIKASKIGYSTSGNQVWADQTKQLSTYDKLLDKMYKDERKDLGGISSLKNQMAREDKRNATAYSDMQDEMINNNQKLFKAEYLEDYQTHFRGMVTDITGVWQVGQGLMTAAGVSGETQRIASMAAFGLQGISILTSIAKSAIIVEAWQSAAAAYKSAMVGLPFPINAIVAPIFAAATFAAVAAMGAFGGGIGGGGGGESGIAGQSNATNMQAAVPYHSGGVVAHEGLLVAHNGLLPDERLVKVLTGEPILRREAMAAYTSMGITFDDLNNARLPVRPVGIGGQGGGGTVNHDNKQVHFHIAEGAININPPQGMTDLQAEQMVRRQIMPALEKVMGNRGLNLIG